MMEQIEEVGLDAALFVVGGRFAREATSIG
jgi:hypothetical protein